MTYEIYATKRFLNGEMQDGVRNKVAKLGDNPYLGVPLTAEFKGKYKLRIGDLRIIYEIDHQNKRIFLVAIGLRKSIYDREK